MNQQPKMRRMKILTSKNPSSWASLSLTFTATSFGGVGGLVVDVTDAGAVAVAGSEVWDEGALGIGAGAVVEGAVRGVIPRGFAGCGGSPCGDKVTAAPDGGVLDGGGVPTCDCSAFPGADGATDECAGAIA